MFDNIISSSVRSVLYYLNLQQRRQAVVQLILLLISSVLDVFGLASLVPVLLVAGEPNGIQKNKFFSSIFHALSFTSERNFLIFLIASVLVFFLIKNLFSAWVNYLQAKFTAKIGLGIIDVQIKKYINLPFWNFTDLGSANLVNSSLNVPASYINAIVRPLFVFFSEITVIIITSLAMLVYKPVLIFILSAILAPTTILTYKALRTRSQAIGNKLNELKPESFSIVNNLFAGFVELKLAGRQGEFADRLITNQALVQELDAESYLHSLLPTRIIEMVAIIGVLTIFIYSLFGPAGAGGLFVLVGMFAAAAYRLMPSVNRLLMTMVHIKQNQFSIENLELFRNENFNESPAKEQLPLSFNQGLSLRNISYRFPTQTALERPALHGINIDIKKGEKIGFIGASGSGKTTMMNVLLRFYREQQGQIVVDGQSLTPNHLRAWYELVGYVKQDTFLMESSIKDNITLGAPVEQIDHKRLQYAIEQASLSSFVNNLPSGLDTLIGERGSKLSGGQRQRIGIARALYKQAEILLLDEATSALDNETEREVNAAISQLAHTNITLLIIAHRLTTLRECDRIYEMSGGEIVAIKQYSELVD